MWEPNSDNFTYHTHQFHGPSTKRTILSYISQIFDPLGWLTPVVFWAKHFLQQLWLFQCDWDEPLNPILRHQWETFVAEIHLLQQIKIPRKFPNDYQQLRLIGFCDASQKGFAACIYLCFLRDSSNYTILLKAKSKVAPLTPLSIPRLELSGALLLAKLFVSVRKSLSTFKIEETLLYTDAQIVLAWLQTMPHILKPFVANRVVKIIELTNPESWYYISSKENCADAASRGMTPQQLSTFPSWIYGPEFLSQPPNKWPRQRTSIPDSDIPEKRKGKIVLNVRTTEDVLCKFSSLVRLQRVFAYVRRFINNARYHNQRKTGALSLNELREALISCVFIVQRHYYVDIIEKLKNNISIPTALSKLSPFLDTAGLLRVGGRLRHSYLPFEQKHPLLLPKHSHLSALICDFYHLYSLHSGPLTVQALISQKFWIVSLRSLLRQRIHRCLTCHRFKATPAQPIMADLPAYRTQLVRAFLQVGTDFGGPFLVKESKRRSARIYKGYLCLFVCMSTKATHLEFVTELSTSAFLAVFDRFVSRRGLPQTIYSDCGRNYIGAANHLKEITRFLHEHKDQIFSSLSAKQINWNFDPPTASNFGGIWEAGIKSAKNLLKRLIKDTAHTFEEYTTLFARIEATLNSRPLCSVSFDPMENTDYLSPGHFLIGSPLLSPPEPDIPGNITFKCRWQRLRQLFQQFCAPNNQEGDVVFMCGINTHPLSWPIGRVETVLPGPDGVVRVVRVRTASGQYIRPVNKLVTLPPQIYSHFPKIFPENLVGGYVSAIYRRHNRERERCAVLRVRKKTRGETRWRQQKTQDNQPESHPLLQEKLIHQVGFSSLLYFFISTQINWLVASLATTTFTQTISMYRPDEFHSHFRMYRETFHGIVELLAPKIVNVEQLGPGRPHINVEKQVLVFLWFMANQEVFRILRSINKVRTDLVPTIILADCVLHNIGMRMGDDDIEVFEEDENIAEEVEGVPEQQGNQKREHIVNLLYYDNFN
ncbi:uncharacterized protein LOC135143819 [Zophobas morio]|uniref:uncharacterized protein LOC135143819 n=1 Tax=Zophobas morio TaxID=2755281 RepID=UPI0030830C5A